MRGGLVLVATCGSLAIVAACAGSEPDARPDPDPPETSIPDATVPDAAVPDVDVPDTRFPDCSGAGWCITPFPDEDLVFRDIWPFADNAFAIAESALEGVKVLEWRKSTNAWKYIDDTSQNGLGVGTFAGAIYAPNADNVYFTVGPSYVYHGTRPVSPATKWTWTRQKLPDNVVGHPASHDHGNPVYGFTKQHRVTFGVWGTAADNVYAYYSNTIFRRDVSNGEWSAVYTADDLDPADEHVYFTSVSGTGPDDIWFAGARDRDSYQCPLIVRRTAEGWERIADSVVNGTCSELPGTLNIGGVGNGWLTTIQPMSPTEYITIHEVMTSGYERVDFTRIRSSDAGYSFEQSAVPIKSGNPIYAMWRGSGETWLTSWGLVLHRADDGEYTPSTISRDGAPVFVKLYQIRGTSNQDLWAVGARHAYHKTTP